MRISVCIPCYNRPELVLEAINSALIQNPPPYEILVGDDSKDDRVQKVISKLINSTNTIRYWHHQPSLGQAKNVQFLFSEARGNLISLMHDDDLYLNNAFETLILPFKREPNIILSFGKQVVISDSGAENQFLTKDLNESYMRFHEREGLISKTLEASAVGMVPSNGYLVRSEAAKSIDYYAENRAYKACDFYFAFRLGKTGKPFYYSDKPVSCYRLTSESSARSGTNSGYYSFKILMKDLRSSDITETINEKLRARICPAISQAAHIDKLTGFRWYFSKWHRRKIPTTGGIKRLLKLIFY